jgi:uncharacterized RDD family membrane protein YckC
MTAEARLRPADPLFALFNRRRRTVHDVLMGMPMVHAPHRLAD